MKAEQEHDLQAAIAAAWQALTPVLLDYRTGSPEQAAAWAAALHRLPAAWQDRLPPLARLIELGSKAWPD